jgi:hypothetical protein
MVIFYYFIVFLFFFVGETDLPTEGRQPTDASAGCPGSGARAVTPLVKERT